MKTAASPARARAFGAGAASFVVALWVCAFTYMLRTLDFAPVSALISQEDHLYDAIHSPDIRLRKYAHRVVFIDIDDAAVGKWSSREEASSPRLPLPDNTPRALIAQLVKYVRKAQAKVVYLDFDFRDSLTGDEDLKAELEQPNPTPILIPTFFTSGRLPSCQNQGAARPPTELQTVFSSLTGPAKPAQAVNAKDLPSITLVHPVLTRGAYGLTEGACSFYRVHLASEGEVVSREAAMVRAVAFANEDAPTCKPGEACVTTPDLSRPETLPIRWTIGRDTDLKHDSADKSLVYARVKAGNLVQYQSVPDPVGGEADVLKDAIVVIGSTGQWSEDTLATPVGDLQGALAHVNFALSLQSFDDEVPLLAQFGLDVVFLIIATVVAVRWCWLPTYEALARKAELSARQRLWRIFFETCVFAICGLVFAAVSVILLLVFRLGFLAGWRFGILSFFVGTIAGLMIELCSAAADGAREWAERYMTRTRS